MDINRLELELNIKKMETGILERRFEIHKRYEDVARIEAHIEIMEDNKKEFEEKLDKLGE